MLQQVKLYEIEVELRELFSNSTFYETCSFGHTVYQGVCIRLSQVFFCKQQMKWPFVKWLICLFGVFSKPCVFVQLSHFSYVLKGPVRTTWQF